MLPHILHSTTRAAAVVQNQTQVLKSVLQIQSSGPSSGSGSSRGNGPSSGGSKYNAGSRFHAGLNSAGRAVAQANAVSSHDGTVSQSDETEEIPARRTMRPTHQKRHRMRSSSVSLTVAGRDERGLNLGVLQTVQIHARARHAFAPEESLALAKQRLLADPIPHTTDSEPARSPLLVRRNSTSAPLSPLMSPALASVPLPATALEGAVEALADGPPTALPTTADTATPQSAPPPSPEADRIIQRLDELTAHGDHHGTVEYIRYLINKYDNLAVQHFNAGFDALLRTRTPGEPLNPTIKLYNQMLEKSVVPNVETYEKLIQALTTRDWEIHRATVALEQRVKHVRFSDRDEVATLESDQGRIETLKTEDNFPSAMSLFEGILAIGGRDQLTLPTFTRLLRSCASHGDWKAAVHVFAQLESVKSLRVNHSIYQNMILTFIRADRLEATEEIFNTYLKACKQGRLGGHVGRNADAGRHAQIQVWNTMIEAYFRFNMPDKAVELVDQMVSSTAGNQFAVSETPIPTSSSFTTVIAGFVLDGDVKSALAWFDKLLIQDKAPANPYQGLDGRAMRPNSVAWHIMLDALAKEGMVRDLNRLYTLMKRIQVEDHLHIRTVDTLIVHRANLDNIDKFSNEEALDILNWLTQDLNTPPFTTLASRFPMMTELCLEYVKRNEYVAPCNILTEFIISRSEYFTSNVGTMLLHEQVEMQRFYVTIRDAIYQNLQASQGALPWLAASTLWRLGNLLNLKHEARFAPYVIPAYSHARFVGEIVYEDFHFEDWDVLLRYSTYLELNASRGNPDNLPSYSNENGLGRVSSILQDIASHGVTFDAFADDVKRDVMEVLAGQYGGEHGRNEFLKKLGPSYAQAADQVEQMKYGALENALSQPAETLIQPASTLGQSSPTPSSTYVDSDHGSASTIGSGLSMNTLLSRAIQDLLEGTHNHKPKLGQAYKVFEKNLRNKMVPEPAGLAKLIQSFGRANDLEKVREFYTLAQDVLPLVKSELQLECWAQIEDSMIIALAHAGHPDAAHVHRIRILEQGMAPSADAYGILIQLVKDTTDDTSGAMALFREAQERGVHLNLYLYNNIISKLSKARKADYALELFQQMKSRNLTPSSITYGAVIGACARVGDVKSAEILFDEMTHSKNFKPRVPPYNTMMQLYTTTKPNRKSALHYYSEMRRAGVKPSSHTYKLLLDTHGSIEPIDIRAMEEVFSELQDNASVELTGAHFAALINAHGCAAKDFDKAIAIFETMEEVPRAPAPDAVVFEAIINVLVAHKRVDLLPVYVEKMNQAGVHMTAYIANFLIKGYANVGDLERSREIFESLVDPPFGIAAPNNHAPHNATDGTEINIMEPVFREPSTWETMVRAELGAGNRDEALDLLDRLQTRGYPEAVYNRISGVMTDHSAVIG
ncbi:hypothetical protein CPB83DRAFT_849956 [Crepidotus variabilis]|uniref:PROP1-like PPR domain-containing protein n=1 Tax=Crepidotus variabilis TaxID=179855 RepID=A0A9P6JSP2_9AGAR|nr:hypothetical protein CPB83DRAFT_849956 [Crepidotus variabilis]